MLSLFSDNVTSDFSLLNVDVSQFPGVDVEHLDPNEKAALMIRPDGETGACPQKFGINKSE